MMMMMTEMIMEMKVKWQTGNEFLVLCFRQRHEGDGERSSESV